MTLRFLKGLTGLVIVLSLFVHSRVEAVVVASPEWIITRTITLPRRGYDLEVDASGNLYVSDCSDSILKIDPAGHMTSWSNARVCDLTWSGSGIAYGVGSYVIRVIEPDGTFSNLSQDSLAWNAVVGLADGSLYANVGCCDKTGLYKIDVTSGQAIPVVVGGPGPGGVGSYGSMAQGADGKVYLLAYDTAGRLYRLDGSQLNLVATYARVGGNLCRGPGATFLTNVTIPTTTGSQYGEIHQLDPSMGTNVVIAHTDIDGPHLYPYMTAVTYDPNTQTAYVLESTGKIWVLEKVPPIVASFGPGEATADTVSVTASWPIEINTPVYVNLERSTDGIAFSGRTSEHVYDSGTVSFVDRIVVPGTRYAYRAYVMADSGTVYSPLVWVDVPPLTPPPPPIQIWSAGSVSVDTLSVTLDWPINPILTGDVRVERRTPPAAYGSIAAIHLTGDGHVHFVDEAVARGASYIYRAGILADTGWVWSNELAAQVPAVSSAPVWGDGAVAVGASSVTLEWPINARLAGDVRVERKTAASGFGLIGSLHLVGDGKVQFVDNQVIAGESYAYRAGFPYAGGWDWSDELNASIPQDSGTPTAYSLAFFAGRSFIVQGSLDVAFTLPAAGPARVEAYDVSGRKIATAAVDAPQAGAYSVHLADAGSLRPGMCFLRLVQGTSQAQSRAIVIGR